MPPVGIEKPPLLLLGFVMTVIFCFEGIRFLVGSAEAADSNAADRETTLRANYFPNTEALESDEIRVVSLGTGSPNFRRSQASAAWLVELGNGDKFLFDIGTGSLANLGALEIPYSYLDKVFISHLHVDHIGDLDSLFIGGWVSNRVGPLRIWGPSGLQPETGTAYAIDRMREMYTWDLTGRRECLRRVAMLKSMNSITQNRMLFMTTTE